MLTRKQIGSATSLALVLYAYRTAVHSTTGVSPFELMFGRQCTLNMAELSDVTAFDPASYQAQLHARLAELQNLVELNIAEAAREQKTAYDWHSAPHSFMVGDPVWLSVPTAGKLSPRWEGKWTVKTVLSQINMEITDGRLIISIACSTVFSQNTTNMKVTGCPRDGIHASFLSCALCLHCSYIYTHRC